MSGSNILQINTCEALEEAELTREPDILHELEGTTKEVYIITANVTSLACPAVRPG